MSGPDLRELLREERVMWLTLNPKAPDDPFRRLLREAGRSYTPIPWKGRQRKLKECFANCGRLALERLELTYVEGLAMDPEIGIPFHHAWLTDGAGNALEPTIRTRGRRFLYLGVEIPTEEVIERTVKTEHWTFFFWGDADYAELCNRFEEKANGATAEATALP